jgi:hypothetical protein
MRAPYYARVLVVALQTADSPRLIEAVSRRAEEGPCRFTLLVPARRRGLHPVVEPLDHGLGEAEARLEAAVGPLSDAAGSEVIGIVGVPEPFTAVEDALTLLGFDEVIVALGPGRASRWSDLDLPQKLRSLGVPVTEVIAAAQFDETAA